jgi:TRAP-type transport system small permease protein
MGFNRIFDLMLVTFAGVACACVIALSVGMTCDVIMRNVGWGSIPGVLDASEFAVMLIAFLGAPWVLRHGGHVQVDVFTQMVPPRLQRTLQFLCETIGIAVSGMLLAYGIVLGSAAYSENARVIRTFIFPEWWVYAVVTLSAAMLLIEFVRRLFRLARIARDQSPPPSPSAGH